MNRQDWITRCAARLQDQWPRLPQDQLVEVAAELRRELERQAEQPETAANAWLGQAIPLQVTNARAAARR